jgi:hypothetical protein
MTEKQILNKLVNLTERDTKETQLIIKNLAKEIILDGNLQRNDKLTAMIVSLNDSICNNNECLDYLNKRLAEINPNKPCEHYFAVAWVMVSKKKKYYYYKNCAFCGCEPLETLKDLNE